MTIGEFLLLACIAAGLVLFVQVGMKGIGPPFLHSLLRRLLDVALTAAVVAVLFAGSMAFLQWAYMEGVSHDDLTRYAGYQGELNSWLDMLPSPLWLALAAFALAIISSLSSNPWTAVPTIGFLKAQPWLNRLSVAAAILSSFSFLNSDGQGAHLWISATLGRAQAGAVEMQQQIDNLALSGSASELFDDIARTIPDEKWSQVVAAGNRISGLEDMLGGRTAWQETPAETRARSWLSRQWQVTGPGSRLSDSARPQVDQIGETYRKLSAKRISELKSALQEIKSNLSVGEKASRLRHEIRSSFVELAAKAVVANRTTILAPTDNAILNLLAEAVTETAIERLKARAAQISKALESAIGAERIQRVVEFKARVVEILAANAMPSFAVRTPGEEKFRLLRATQYQAADLARQIAVERADSICPPDEILLYCSRGGAPFCASPTREHDRC